MPYFLIAGVWYSIKYIFIEFSLTDLFVEFSTLSFWLQHKGAWYVAMLIPLYILYPFYNSFIEKRHRGVKTFFVVLILLIIELYLYVFHGELYNHLCAVINSVLVFVLGNYIAEAVYDKKKISILWLIIPLVLHPVRVVIDALENIDYISNLTYAILGIGFVCIAGICFNHVNIQCIMKIFRFMGSISLELYLTNIFLIQLLNILIDRNIWIFSYGGIIGIIEYVIIVILGIILSYISSKIRFVYKH